MTIVALTFLAASLAASPAEDLGKELCKAARNGQLEKVRELVEQGADPNWGRTARTVFGCEHALQEAAERKFLEIARVLLEEGGADPNLQIRHLPLKIAIDTGQVEFARLLLDYGADVDLFQRDRQSCIEAGLSQPPIRPEIAKLLEESLPTSIRKSRAERRLRAKTASRTLEKHRDEIEKLEQTGNEHAAAGRRKEALFSYMESLRLTPALTNKDQQLREKIVKTMLAMKPAPEVSEEAKRHADRAQAFLKQAQGVDGYQRVASELEQALLLAPWWAGPYFNLGLMREKLGDPVGAIESLKLYLLAAPNAQDAEEVRKKLIELEVAQELANEGGSPSTSPRSTDERPSSPPRRK